MSSTSPSGRGSGGELPLFDGLAAEQTPGEPETVLERDAPPQEAWQPRCAPLGLRLRAGLADLGVQGAATAILLSGIVLMDAWPGWRLLPALALFLLVFSFLYAVIPLAFWGRTPGMAWVGLVARSFDGQPLSFAQTGLRWLGGVLTVATLGLGLLPAVRGDSLADRLSGSRTYLA